MGEPTASRTPKTKNPIKVPRIFVISFTQRLCSEFTSWLLRATTGEFAVNARLIRKMQPFLLLTPSGQLTLIWRALAYSNLGTQISKIPSP